MSSKPAITTPTSTKGGKSNLSQKIVSPQTSAAVALNMSWQLLIVVIVPIVGGHLLDHSFNTGPIYMVVGMFVAVVAMIIVVRQAMQGLGVIMPSDKEQTK